MKKTKKTLLMLLALLLMITAIPVNAQAASSVKLDKTKATVYTGGTTTLKVTGTSKKVIWTSNKKSVATVSSKGVITAKKAGAATLTAKVGSRKLTCKVTVKKENPKLSKTKTTVYAGGTTTLKVTGTSRKVTWVSSKKSVATVSSKGVVTAKKSGTATITARVGSRKLTCKVTVKKEAPKLSKTKVTLSLGDSATLKLSGTSRKVTWVSSKITVATVSSKGVVTAKKSGTAYITAKLGKKTYKCKVTVKQPKLSASFLSLSKGTSKTVKLNNVYGGDKVSWKSSDSAVVYVKRTGQDTAKLSAKKNGTATITAKVYGKTYQCKVTVKTASKAKLSKTSETVLISYSEQLRVTGTSKEVSWYSSDPSVAKVDSTGKVTGKKAGTATITAKVDGTKLRCKVTVPKYRLHVLNNSTEKIWEKDVKEILLGGGWREYDLAYEEYGWRCLLALTGTSSGDKVTWELVGSKEGNYWGGSCDRFGRIDGLVAGWNIPGYKDGSCYILEKNDIKEEYLNTKHTSTNLRVRVNGKVIFTIKVKYTGSL